MKTYILYDTYKTGVDLGEEIGCYNSYEEMRKAARQRTEDTPVNSFWSLPEVINPPYFFAEAKLNISQRSKAVTNTIPTTPEINWPTKTVDANSQ